MKELEVFETAIANLNKFIEQGTSADSWQNKTWRKRLVAAASQVANAGRKLSLACSDTPDLAELAKAAGLAAQAGDGYRAAMRAWLKKDQKGFKLRWLLASTKMTTAGKQLTALGTRLIAEGQGLKVTESKLSKN